MKERQRNESTSFRENNMLKSCEVLSKIHVSKIHDMSYEVKDTYDSERKKKIKC